MFTKLNECLAGRLQWLFLISAIVVGYLGEYYSYKLFYKTMPRALVLLYFYSALLLLLSIIFRNNAGKNKMQIKVYLIIAIFVFFIKMIPIL